MSIVLDNISKYFGHQVVVNNVNLDVSDGEFFVLLGASGSGKTTILNMIAGLLPPDHGQIKLNERDVTWLPTQERKVGYVFQNYALFQHMTIAQNIEFGLQVRKVPKEKRQKKRDELLELVGLVGMAERMPHQLSGGQQQRVALARALAPEPDVLLLDEPLGALDTKIRVGLRRSLKRIQRESGVAAILVTHDQEEAFDLADRIGVMNYGRLIEVGTPQKLYQNPQTEYVATFLGSANLLVGQIRNDQIGLGKHSIPLTEKQPGSESNGRAQILFRPEDVAIDESIESLGCFPLGEGKVIERGFNGANEYLQVEMPAIEGVRAIAPPVPYGTPGFLVEVSRSPEQTTAFPVSINSKVSVGIRRLQVLSHPGLNFLLINDGSLLSQSAVSTGGYLARMAHAHVLMLGLGQNEEKLVSQMQDARKQIGSGMASLQVETSSAPFPEATVKAIEKQHADLVILGWRPTAGLEQPRDILLSGEHHLLLAPEPITRLSRALICLASGEPAKDTVIFGGRLLRHLGAEATLMTVTQQEPSNSYVEKRIERFLKAGQNSLANFGVPTQIKIKKGPLVSAVQEELSREKYDLVVLGAPLPNQLRKSGLEGFVGQVIRSVENCAFLIVQSQSFQQHINPFRSEK